MTAFNTKWKYEKLAVAVRVPQTTQNLHFTLLFCRGRQKNAQRFITHVHILGVPVPNLGHESYQTVIF